jgi:hypothetical protein
VSSSTRKATVRTRLATRPPHSVYTGREGRATGRCSLSIYTETSRLNKTQPVSQNWHARGTSARPY